MRTDQCDRLYAHAAEELSGLISKLDELLASTKAVSRQCTFGQSRNFFKTKLSRVASAAKQLPKARHSSSETQRR